MYFRNDSLANQLTREKILSLNCASVCVWNNTDYNKNIKYPPKSPLKAKEQDRERGRIFKQVSQNVYDVSPLAQAMYQSWVDATEEYITTPKLSQYFAEKLLSALKTFFHNSLERWKDYCRRIASSDFLMGKRGSFKAWLIWVIKDDVIQKVRAGSYGIIAEDGGCKDHDVIDIEAVFKTTIAQQTSCLKQKVNIMSKLINLQKKIGSASYLSWFGNCKFKENGDRCVISLSSLGQFQKESILSKYGNLLKEYELI